MGYGCPGFALRLQRSSDTADTRLFSHFNANTEPYSVPSPLTYPYPYA